MSAVHRHHDEPAEQRALVPRVAVVALGQGDGCGADEEGVQSVHQARRIAEYGVDAAARHFALQPGLEQEDRAGPARVPTTLPRRTAVFNTANVTTHGDAIRSPGARRPPLSALPRRVRARRVRAFRRLAIQGRAGEPFVLRRSVHDQLRGIPILDTVGGQRKVAVAHAMRRLAGPSTTQWSSPS